MKADTDSFVNRRQLMRQLNALDSSEALYVGTPATIDVGPWTYAAAGRGAAPLVYHLGGPGYIFSRGLMERLDLDACFQNMALDPIWLIHDDVGTGYCATRFLKTSEEEGAAKAEGPTVIAHRGVVASTFRCVPHRLIAAALEDASLYPVEGLRGSALDLLQSWLRGEPPLSPGAADCVLLAQVWHPVTPAVMRALDRFLSVDSAKRAEALAETAGDSGGHPLAVATAVTAHECMFVAMAGEEVVVGDRWSQGVGGVLAESLVGDELVEVRREYHTLRDIVDSEGSGADAMSRAFLKLHRPRR
jgi:hypothetical protein